MSNVKVAIKFRPILMSELDKDLQWKVEAGKSRIKSTNGKHNLLFGKSQQR